VTFKRPHAKRGSSLQQIKTILANSPDSLGSWEHSLIFSEAHTAKEWGMTPSQFRELSHNDKAEMIAHDRIYSVMQSYEAYLSKPKENKAKGKK